MVKGIVKTTVLLGIIVLIASTVLYYSDINPTKQDKINNSIDKGIEYLYKAQEDNGKFRTLDCSKETMENCTLDSSPFITSFVIYSIQGIKDKRSDRITERGIEFLKEDKDEHNLWSYYSDNNSKTITPDVDDTATVSYIIEEVTGDGVENKEYIEENRNEQGLFFTWINISEYNMSQQNDIDCVVNANALLYLGDEYTEVCNFINKAVTENRDCYKYYNNRLVFYYMVSRAYIENADCLEKSKDMIIEDTFSRKKPDGSFGTELETALAINTLVNFGYPPEKLNESIDYLIRTQNKDGSWDKDLFYCGIGHHYGSDGLTTAIVMEALDKSR